MSACHALQLGEVAPVCIVMSLQKYLVSMVSPDGSRQGLR